MEKSIKEEIIFLKVVRKERETNKRGGIVLFIQICLGIITLAIIGVTLFAISVLFGIRATIKKINTLLDTTNEIADDLKEKQKKISEWLIELKNIKYLSKYIKIGIDFWKDRKKKDD